MRSKITEAGNIAFFAEGENWLIDQRDELAAAILELVRKAKKKTKVHKHKGTYRMRAWLLPEEGTTKRPNSRPFGRQGP